MNVLVRAFCKLYETSSSLLLFMITHTPTVAVIDKASEAPFHAHIYFSLNVLVYWRAFRNLLLLVCAQ